MKVEFMMCGYCKRQVASHDDKWICECGGYATRETSYRWEKDRSTYLKLKNPEKDYQRVQKTYSNYNEVCFDSIQRVREHLMTNITQLYETNRDDEIESYISNIIEYIDKSKDEII